MQLNFATLALCLLGAVVLCGAQSGMDLNAIVHAENASHTSAEPITDTNQPTTGKPSETTAVPATPTQVHSTVPATNTSSVSEAEGLSPGAIAGITIGSIAGVAAVGGGIFGVLKYTGRI